MAAISPVRGAHMTDQHQWGSASPAVFLQRIALWRATDLARRGRYDEAETPLQELVQPGQVLPEVWDLFARVKAQQGRLAEAAAMWKQAARVDPGNEVYEAGLRRIAQIERHRKGRPIVLTVGIGVALVVFVGIITWKSWDRGKRKESSPLNLSQNEPVTSGTVQAAKLDLRAPGVVIHSEANALVATFEAGVFSQGTSLTPEARTALTTLGRQLEPYSDRISVVVTGHADNIPVPEWLPYRDNIDLGYRRAIAVIDHLRASAQLPSSAFAARSLGKYGTPYDHATPESRVRNRTVIIRIFLSSAEKGTGLP